MSRLFYHVMQDNTGNLLFGVSGTMRVAGSGTLATIYGDEALTVILPNPMTNHPSYGSFKCFLPNGDFDFYMAKAGYTFETLTGVQGHGSMAQQDASAVAITGGTGAFTSLTVSGQTHLMGEVGMGIPPLAGLAIRTDSTRMSAFGAPIGIGTTPLSNVRLAMEFDKGTTYGLKLKHITNDGGPGQPVNFHNMADAVIGSITSSNVAVAYNTTSDARLKDDVQPLAGALDVIQALNPVSFLWKADGTPGHGFLAHEVQDVIPAGVITGEKDAVDDAGQIVPQMIDYSKLVPYLIGSIKELCEQVQALQAKLDMVTA